jgi:uncharacterized protein YegJ (DUF2314 family)
MTCSEPLSAIKAVPLSVLIALLVFTACDSKKSSNETILRDGQPDYIRVLDQDPEMNKAIQTARDSVDTFIAALKAPAPGRGNFTVKKPFKDGEMVEHIWLSNASFDGTQFSGQVDNEPVDVKNVKLGQTATAAKKEISDWFYVENGKLVGGYTIRVLYSRMPPAEKKAFDANVGFKLE